MDVGFKLKFLIMRISKKNIFIALLAFHMVSCQKDYLQRDPYGILNESEFFKTDGAGLKMVTSCYQPMADGWGYTVNKIAIMDESVDNADAGGSDPGDRPQTTEVGTGRPLASNALLNETWSNRYRGIGKCNQALASLEKEGGNLIENGQKLSSSTLARYIAEVKFLRAWYYFDLVTVFKEVPLITTIEEPTTRLAKASIEDLRNQIFKDLDEAIADPNFPRHVDLSASETGRASKDAALAIKARSSLFFAGLMEQSIMTGNANAE